MGFLFKNNHENLYPAYKMDLDLLDSFRIAKPRLNKYMYGFRSPDEIHVVWFKVNGYTFRGSNSVIFTVPPI